MSTAATSRTPVDRAAVLGRVVADLAAESQELDTLLGDLTAADWSRPTPAAGWSILDQVTHLAFFDDATVLALTDRDAFLRQRSQLLALGDGFPDVVAERHRHLDGARCREWAARARADLLAAYRAADPAVRLPWFGPDMGVASSATGRLMETWAHGQDVRDTLDVPAVPTPRLRHIADLGIRTFAFVHTLRGRSVPDAPVRVELTGPAGQPWTWGPAGATDLVTGDALEFCLVVTQRRNVADTGLTVTGPVAESWIPIAQAFAGAATDPRPAGLFPPRSAPEPPETR